jgi:pimeloyl-ACP methyl ester carboxylesterase
MLAARHRDLPWHDDVAAALGDARIEAAARAAGREDAGFDAEYEFLHDVPPEVLATGVQREQSDGPFTDGWSLPAWPDVPVTVVVGRDDRFFPADFQVRLARERAGVEPIVLPGGHLLALAQPDVLVREGLDVPPGPSPLAQ